MTKSIPLCFGSATAVVAAAVALVSPVRSETIYSLSDGAACRDKNGAVQTPRSAPQPVVAAEMTASGMLHVTGVANTPDCYFFTSEVGLEPVVGKAAPAACPLAAVGLEKSRLAGTRDITGGCSK
jgi:hypothetical protein